MAINLWELLIVFGFLILVIAYLWRSNEKRQRYPERIFYGRHQPTYPYKRRHNIQIGTRRPSIRHPQSNYHNRVIVRTQTNSSLEGNCSVCGRSSISFGNPIKCKNPDCSRWYHPKCVKWISQNGRLKCSCGARLP